MILITSAVKTLFISQNGINQITSNKQLGNHYECFQYYNTEYPRLTFLYFFNPRPISLEAH